MDYCKNGNVLHKKYEIMLIQKCSELFDLDKTLVSINVPDEGEITVCGDIHG